MKKILIIEDDFILSRMLENWMMKKNLPTLHTASILTAKKIIRKGELSLVLSDLRLPDGDGVELLEWMNTEGYHYPFIVMTCYGQIGNAVKAIKLGAVDYLCKPLQPEILFPLIMEVLEQKKNGIRNTTISYYQGTSSVIQECKRMIELIAPTEMSVLIRGANGTGKEYVARSIHAASQRAKKLFVAIDCGSIPRELASSELFGHRKGAFTGAFEDKEGVFCMADGATLFLDEIGNLGYDVQVLLLRALQEKSYRPIGSPKELAMDVRIIAATNDNLEKAIEEGRFREDLYHRLNEFTIHVPSLVECREDILPLADFLREQASEELKRDITGFDADARKALVNYAWPGNIREMRHKIRAAILLAKGDIISEKDLCITKAVESSSKFTLKNEEEEKRRILEVLKLTRGNKRLAAGLLKIDRSTLYEKIKKYGIEI